MKVLVTTASRHGSTSEIGARIGDQLHGAGLDTVFVDAEDVERILDYDAVVIGSGIYAGAWLKPARLLIERNAADFLERPVWLFSSGPVGDIKGSPVNEDLIADLMERSGAEGHMMFNGKLDKSDLSLPERAIVGVLKVPEGDFRDWEAIDGWAAEIAGHLVPVS